MTDKQWCQMTAQVAEEAIVRGWPELGKQAREACILTQNQIDAEEQAAEDD